MRISDWSSDVCSSDLADLLERTSLDSESRTQWTQRIAWAWYNAGDDRRALVLAQKAAGDGGEWSAMANWVAGLSAFRSRQYALARAEERRVGKECVSTCSSRGSP